MQIPAEGQKISSNFTKLLKTHAKSGKAAKNNREKQGWLAGAKAGKAGKQQAIETGPRRHEPSRSPRKTKDEAKEEGIIVFLGPGVAAFPRKRARSRDMANAQQKTRRDHRADFLRNSSR